ncbi:RNA polymerase sigma-70 factor, ECF subfamily [Friedmanniella luteola]|uniref:RNA polymerase sigma-70 factor, ECF subfamily n=1 Tax=Friedmanniella luteola TaxID=546871 RepID=A0A1H1YUA7_9ACTN|nr:sigma-70 family RNA polymerase sigma factor [Friedmanniella luteola]SDT24960.1 RNA polymerase sigma-70 factor, ECF subfamily [Friedmanniella luteola]
MTDHDQFDPAIVARAQTGDEVALHALLAAVRPVVLRYCRSRLRSYAGGAEAADDVAQETCVAVLDVLPRYQQQGAPFAAFVYGIAAHKVADAQRGFRRAAVLVEEMPDQTEPSPTPEEQAVSAAVVRATNDLLARLPPRTQQVLLLRAGGLSADAVGERLGMTANAVRVAQHRGVAKLRHLIEGSDEHRELLAGFLRPAVAPVELGLAAGF